MTDHFLYTPILNGALTVAQNDGWRAVTRDRVAEEAGVGAGSVNTVFGTIDALRGAVMHEAVQRQILPIIAQGLADRHPIARAAPVELKKRALDLML